MNKKTALYSNHERSGNPFFFQKKDCNESHPLDETKKSIFLNN